MLAVLIGGLSMVSPFSIDTFFPAFHAMEKALDVSAWQLQQVITAYMLPFAFASLVHGPLSDAIGRRPVMIAGMAFYTVGSIACTFAQNYEQLIAARVIQGMTAGVGVVIGRAVIRDLYEGPRAQKLMAATTMIFSIAPAVAPIIGAPRVHISRIATAACSAERISTHRTSQGSLRWSRMRRARRRRRSAGSRAFTARWACLCGRCPT